MLNKVIKLPVYDCTVKFTLTDKIKAEIAKIYKKYKIQEELSNEYEGVVLIPTMRNYYLIIDVKYLTYNTIIHEIYHLATKICKDRDIEDEENAAWIAGFLGDALIKALLKKDIKVK